MAADVTDLDKAVRYAAASARTTTKVPVPFVVVFAAAIIATAVSDHAVCKALSQQQ